MNFDFLKNAKNLKNMNRNTILVGIAIIAVIITGVLILAKSGNGINFPTLFGASDKEIAAKVISYINDNKLAQTPATLVNFSRASGLVKVKIKIGTSEFDSYATRDGKLMFPQAFELTPKKETKGTDTNTTSGQTVEQILASVKKSDKPVLEAFIVSACPFGLQMQRMIADAIKSVPALASSVKARYIGSISGTTIVAMHGNEEAQENLRQICIREEQPTKYWNYVSCYMKKSAGAMANGMPIGDSDTCQASTGIDTAKLTACTVDPNKGLTYAKKDFDLASQYNVSGSPTLVLDGTVIDEFTADNQPVFGGRTSDAIKTVVCTASNAKPSFCSQTLNTASAASSFSATYASASGSTGNDSACE